MSNTELLTIYDVNLNAIGERTRAEVHANELLHQTIRLWIIQGNTIWFQRRSMDKTLFPGRLDLSVTGHIDSGESSEAAVLRETAEEIGLSLSLDDITKLKGIPFPFMRPDGKLDNEFANIFLYKPEDTPHFHVGTEVAGLVAISVQDYDKLLRTREPVTGIVYSGAAYGRRPLIQSLSCHVMCGPNDFCCLNTEEWELVKNALALP